MADAGRRIVSRRSSIDRNWRITTVDKSSQTDQQDDRWSRLEEYDRSCRTHGYRTQSGQNYPKRQNYSEQRDNAPNINRSRRDNISAPPNIKEREAKPKFNSRHSADPSHSEILPRAMHQLAEVLMSSTTNIPIHQDKGQVKLLIPYISDNDQVSFVHHYGDTFHHLLNFSPKVINYEFLASEVENTRLKIEAAIREKTDALYELKDQCHCVLDLDFLKLVFTDPKPPVTPQNINSMAAVDLTKQFDAKSLHLTYFLHNMCFPDGEEYLLDVLQQQGVVIEEKMEEPDDVKLEIYRRGFEYQGKVLSGRIHLNSSDLSFKRWHLFRWLTESNVLSNPGRRDGGGFQTEGGDLRIKTVVILQMLKSELEEMSQSSGIALPSVLTTPNLGGILERDDESGFVVKKRHSGVRQLFDSKNCVRYVMNIDGVQFSMLVSDVDCYVMNKYTNTLIKERTAKRWVKFRLLLPPRDSSEVDHQVSMLTDLVIKLMDALGSGLVKPKIWSTNFIYHGVCLSTPCVTIQRIRRRVIENDELPAMLDLPADASESEISESFHKLLADIEMKCVPFAAFESNKLKEAGRRAGLLE